MGTFFDWFRTFHRAVPSDSGRRDPGSYHRRRVAQEQRLARDATSAAAQDAHHRLAAAHRSALERLERAGD